jgi:outer membrane receptor protein involved in Fe transport
MKQFFFLMLLILSAGSFTYAQTTTVRGKVTDENGEAVIGAPVVLSIIHSVGTVTDVDGNYTLAIPDTNPQIIVVSYIGFQPAQKTILPESGKVAVLNFTLKAATQAIHEVEITAKAVKSKEYYMEKVKTNSATSIDYVSSETMKKTGDNNVAAAVARVVGVSTNGAFITVRGIGDRYVKTAINGSRMPTLDPFTNNIKLDLFPASLVDNVIITKTQSPDLPGDWSGAYLSIETKDYPDQLGVNVETKFGYNDQSTFKDVISSQRSSTDWLGYDNSFRDHDHNTFVDATITPTQYQEFIALGLGPYYSSIGVTQDNWSQDHENGDAYFKLGLVQLGLLPPGLINDAAAVASAKSQYASGSYKSDAFKIINAGVPASGKSFPVNWNATTRTPPLNFSQSFSIGNQVMLFGKPLGFIGGFRYGSATQYDPNSATNREDQVGDGNGHYILALTSSEAQQSSIETNGWNALANVAYKLNSNNSFSFLFMPNFVGVNNVKHAVDNGDIKNIVITNKQFYEHRKQLVYQFKSEHYLSGPKLKAEVNASYTNGKSSAPDFKNIQYYKDPVSNAYQIGGTIGNGIHRYYRYLSDNLFDSRVSFEFPLKEQPGIARKLKFGGTYQHDDLKNDQYDYSVLNGTNVTPLLNEDIDSYFSSDKFEIHSGTDPYGVPYSAIDWYYTEGGSAANHIFGNSTIVAAYVMTDYSLTSRLRFAGGLRVEHADLFTDVYKFDSLGLAPNDPRRVYSSSYPVVNPGKLNETSYLPSASIIYKLRFDDDAPMNLRLNYSQTVARPSLRELNDVAYVDYDLKEAVYGNSDLVPVSIQNYDVRIENYFKSGDNVSVSLFYKNFKNNIELVHSNGNTWRNVDKSNIAGVELEGKKILTKHFSIGANVTLVKSETNYVRTRDELSNGIKNVIPLDTVERAMYGQAPYAVNGILTYTADSLGLIVTASYNIQGARLVIVSDKAGTPDVYELPRNLFDVKIMKTLGRHFSIGVTAKDIINDPVRRSYKNADGYSLDYDRYSYGTTYLFEVSYKL